jgi:hypothetical protein
VRVVEVVVDRADRRGLADRQRRIALDALRRYQAGREAGVPDKPDGSAPIGSIVSDGA